MPRQNYQPVPLVEDTSQLKGWEWAAYRKQGLFSSDTPVIAEKSEYKSILGLFLDKVDRRPIEELHKEVTERIKDDAEKKPKIIEPQLELFGKLRQPIIDPDKHYELTIAVSRNLKKVIGEYLSCRLGFPLYEVPMIFRHPHHPFLCATADYIAILPDENGELRRQVLVKCKSATHWKLDDIEDELPPADEMVCRHEMCVLNIDEAIIIYLCDNNDGGVVSYQIHRDYNLENNIIQLNKGFWVNHVETEFLPIPTVYTDIVKRDIALYAQSRKSYYRPPEILERGMPELVQRYLDMKKVVDQYKEKHDAAKEILGDLERQLSPFAFGKEKATCGDLLLRWKQSNSRSFDWKGLKMAYPEIYHRFVTEKTTPGFEVKVRQSAQADSGKEAA